MEAGALLNKRGILVATRSGFVDIMLHTGAPIVCLDSDADYSYFQCYRLDVPEVAALNPNIEEIIYHNDLEETAENIIAKIEEIGPRV